MSTIATTDFGLGGAVAIVFIYVVLRLLGDIRARSPRARKHAAGGVLVALGVPLVLLPRTWPGGAESSAAFLYGSALWIVLALAFAAFAISRIEAPRRQPT